MNNENDSEVTEQSNQNAGGDPGEELGKEFLDASYHGDYLDRSVVRHAKTVKELYENYAPLPSEPLKKIYPAELDAELEALRELKRESAMLKSVRDGAISAGVAGIQFRGRHLHRKDVAKAIAEVDGQLIAVEQKIQAHDRLCRSAHMALAHQYGLGWDVYLKSLLGLMHYADHTGADLSDAQATTSNLLRILTTHGKTSKEALQRLSSSCRELFACVKAAYESSAHVDPGSAVLVRVGVESWSRHFGECKLAAPGDESFKEWLHSADTWINAALSNFRALYEAALSELLKAEAMLASMENTAGSAPDVAPPAVVYPSSYPLLTPGSERPRQYDPDWWTRLQRVDIKPATAGILLAIILMAGALLFFGVLGRRAELTVYNGLATPVEVIVGSEKLVMPPNGYATVKLRANDDVDILATIDGVDIEHIKQHIGKSQSRYVYNVVRAAVFTKWTIAYGKEQANPSEVLGNPSWVEVNVDDLFVGQPRLNDEKLQGVIRTGLSSMSPELPVTQLNAMKNNAGIEQLIEAHVRFDASNTSRFSDWMDLLPRISNPGNALAARLRLYPDDVFALRAEQDMASPSQRDALCQKRSDMAKKESDSPDRQYLAIRCMPHGTAQAQAFMSASMRWPSNPWLQLGAAYVELDAENLEEATRRFAIAFAAIPSAASWANVDIARLRRLRDANANLDDLIKGSFLVDSYHDLETNPRQEGPALAWSLLIRGDLQQAGRLHLPGIFGLNLPILMAASDGAPPEWSAQALSFEPDQNWSQDMLLYCLALATREHRNTSRYLKPLADSSDGDSVQLLDLFQQMQSGKSTGESSEFKGLSLRNRGVFYAMALIVKGKQAPATWRDGAKRLLFGTERPYFY